ncbi:protein ACCELERATED CELL DEATH 6 [Eucalyptus grandis]|uniref:protein ACCELERATED CELL DEATH 6 n=1 Tax=Eucalyptus grandis TaxID=71139 RepID=UPI00192E8349|nr:protein ACCELERATED CELL DEATH 6 [Eucalyptus grandis]
MDDGEPRAAPNERFEALKRRAVPPDYQKELGDDDLHKIMDSDLYEPTEKGDVEKFIHELQKVIESRKLALSLILNHVTPSGNSLLHVAASSGNNDVMELILLHFPNTMAQKNYSEDTSLHVAVQDQRLNETEKLIGRTRDWEIIYWKNKDGKSSLNLAIEKCKYLDWADRQGAGWEIFQLLSQEFARDEAYADKIQCTSPVLAALEEWGEGMLKEIIDRLPKLLHVRDEKGRTPLHVVASGRYFSAVKLLLEKCPHLALQTDENGSYPIHIACEGWSYSVLSESIKVTWSDLAEIKNKNGQNILHVAAKAGNDLVVYWIFKLCSEPDITKKLMNSKDVDGNTPLHLASMHNHCEVMRFLTKDKRIDSCLRNNDGLTALDVAMESRSLSTRNPALVGCAILIVAGVPRSKGQDVLLPREQGSGSSKSSPAKWIKDQVDTLMLVATLVASITFAVGLTLPCGYNASGDPHPGTTTMLYHGAFQVFVIANMFATYNSILVVVVLLWSPSKDFYVAELAYHLAGPLLSMAFTGMSVAFLQP